MKHLFTILLFSMLLVAGCTNPVVREERTETTVIEEKISYDPPPVGIDTPATFDNDSIAELVVLSAHQDNGKKDTVLKMQYVKPKVKGAKGVFKAQYDPPRVDSAGTKKTTDTKSLKITPCSEKHVTFTGRAADFSGGFALCAITTIILLVWYWLSKRV